MSILIPERKMGGYLTGNSQRMTVAKAEDYNRLKTIKIGPSLPVCDSLYALLVGEEGSNLSETSTIFYWRWCLPNCKTTHSRGNLAG
jgi:hypothetical protein